MAPQVQGRTWQRRGGVEELEMHYCLRKAGLREGAVEMWKGTQGGRGGEEGGGCACWVQVLD